mmetsp:Transcript_9553/g.35772  ORF Transcript_9553/g.35772 Transcript_9553/m.35772 type:complete len:239 (+) Transcript_9553:1333-2049(+)
MCVSRLRIFCMTSWCNEACSIAFIASACASLASATSLASASICSRTLCNSFCSASTMSCSSFSRLPLILPFFCRSATRLSRDAFSDINKFALPSASSSFPLAAVISVSIASMRISPSLSRILCRLWTSAAALDASSSSPQRWRLVARSRVAAESCSSNAAFSAAQDACRSAICSRMSSASLSCSCSFSSVRRSFSAVDSRRRLRRSATSPRSSSIWSCSGAAGSSARTRASSALVAVS